MCFFLIINFVFIFPNRVNSSLEDEFEIVPETEQNDFNQIQIEVNSLGTFLRAEPNIEEGESVTQPQIPTIIDLEAVGINYSKWISISYSGEFFYTETNKYTQLEITLIGLFSKTSEIKPIEHLNRVPEAIDSGINYNSGETRPNNLQTDISEDFIIGSFFNNKIEIPHDAKFLFLCIADIYYPDNSGSIQVTITELESYEVILSIENIIILFELIFIALIIIYIRKEIKNTSFLNLY